MPISTSQSLFVSLRFTLSPQFTECPYQLPSHCSSFSVLLSVHESLNAHINFQVIVRLSSFYSQSASNGMPISTSRSLFVSLRFTLSPKVTECPYQLPNHCSSLYVLLSVQSHWIPISTSHSLFVSLRFTLIPQVTEYPYQLPTHCSSLYVLLSVHKSLNTHINCQLIVSLPTFYSQSTSHWMPISTSQPLFVSLRFTLNQQVTECPYQLPLIVRLSAFYSQSTSHWMPISTSRSLFVSLRFTLSPQFTECPYQLPCYCSSLSVLLSVHNSLNTHINFPVIVRLSLFYSQYTSYWMPIPTSQSFFVYLRFTLSQHVTECPYQLPSHCSSLYVLLSVYNSLNAHINFPLIVRFSTFYSQSTSHWMPISTSRSLVVSQRFTLSPQVTECPYQLPSHCSSLYLLLSVNKSLNAHINFPVIFRRSPFYSQSRSHWMSISTAQSLFVFLCFTLSTRVTECPYQHPSHFSSLYVLFSLNKSLNAHINFQVIVRLSSFYSQSTSHWMPISTSQSLFVFLCFTLSTRVTECPYQLPSHFSSLYVLFSIHKSLNVHINFQVIVRLSTFYSQSTSHWIPYQLPSHCSSLYVLLSVHKSLNAHINFPVIIHISTFYSKSTSHWMPISTSKSLFVSLRFTLNPQVTECPYQLPSHCSSLYLLLSVNKSLNAHINFPVIFRLSPCYAQSTSHWMPISIAQSLFVFLCFTLSTRVTECPYQLPSHFSSLCVLLSVHKSLNAHINFQVIVRLSTFYSQSTSHWMPISTSQSFFVALLFTLSPEVTECPYQLPSHCSSFSVLLSVHESLNVHTNIPVISRLSTFYSHSISHWMPISTSRSLFVSLRFTLSPQVTECRYQLPSHCSSFSVLLSVHESLNAHTNFPVISRLSTFYSQSTSHWMSI